MTEKEVEKLFREKLGQREVAFNPGNWQRMEAILDKKAAPKGGYFWRSTAAILAFGAIVASSIYLSPVTNAPAREDMASPTLLEQDLNIRPTVPLEQEDSRKTDQGTENLAGSDNAMSAQKPDAAPLKPSSGEGSMAQSQNRQNETSASQDISNNKEASRPASLEGYAAVEVNESEKAFEVAVNEPKEAIALAPKEIELPQIDLVEMNALVTIEGATSERSPFQKLKNPGGLFVSAGPVFSGSNTNNTLGVGFHAGAGYSYQLPKGFALETGLSYVVQNNVDIAAKSDSTFYKFGRETIETEENTHRLEYLEIPLNISYAVNSKHQFGLGAYCAVLVNANTDIKRTTYTVHKTLVEAEEASGQQDQFNRFDYGLGAFYRYSVSRRFTVGLHIKQGLYDISNNEAKGYQPKHKNFNSRIVLQYSLF